MGLVLLLAGVSAVATADADPVCRIGSTEYATIDLALAAVQDDEMIELLCDCELNKAATLTKRFTLTSAAGGPYKLTRLNAGTHFLTFDAGADVTLTSVTLDGLGKWKLLHLDDASAKVTIGAGACLTNFHGAPATICVLKGTAVLDGGEIVCCSSTSSDWGGGAVYCNGGTFTLKSGTIRDCTASNGQGGGVCIRSGTVNIEGGTIRDCTAKNGGGVYVADGSCCLYLRGGAIRACAATASGGGVYVKGGSTDPSVFVGGTASVTGNTEGTAKTNSNLCPSANDLIHLESGFTGSVGVYYPTTLDNDIAKDLVQFGIADASESDGAARFFWDLEDEFTGTVENGKLKWGGVETTSTLTEELLRVHTAQGATVSYLVDQSDVGGIPVRKDELPTADYLTFSPVVSSDTTVTFFTDSAMTILPATEFTDAKGCGLTRCGDVVATLHPWGKAAYTNRFAALYANVGTYGGETVNLLVTLLDYELNAWEMANLAPEGVGFTTNVVGIATAGANWVKVRFEFLHTDGTPFDLKGYITWNDIDNAQGVAFDAPSDSLHAVTETKTTGHIKAANLSVGSGLAYAYEADADLKEPDDEDGWVTDAFSGSTLVRTFTFIRTGGSTTYGVNLNRSRGIITSSPKTAVMSVPFEMSVVKTCPNLPVGKFSGGTNFYFDVEEGTLSASGAWSGGTALLTVTNCVTGRDPVSNGFSRVYAATSASTHSYRVRERSFPSDDIVYDSHEFFYTVTTTVGSSTVPATAAITSAWMAKDGVTNQLAVSAFGLSFTNYHDAAALMIADHRRHATDDTHVELGVDVKTLRSDETTADWVQRMTANGNRLAVKFGRTRAEMEAAEGVAATLSTARAPADGRFWLDVALPEFLFSTENVAFCRVTVDRPELDWFATAEAPTFTGDEIAASVNVFGALKVESARTNQITAVPWTAYSARESDAQPIDATNLVMTAGLDAGDVLAVYGETSGAGRYSAWRVQANGTWAEMPVCSQVGGVTTVATADPEAVKAARGAGIWVRRAHPCTNAGAVRPYFLFGQSVLAGATNAVPGMSGTRAASSLQANPTAQTIALNDLTFIGGIYTGAKAADLGDTIVVPTQNGTVERMYMYDTTKGWGYWKRTAVQSGARTRYVNTFTADGTIRPGEGFWYERRGGAAISIVWPDVSGEAGKEAE